MDFCAALAINMAEKLRGEFGDLPLPECGARLDAAIRKLNETGGMMQFADPNVAPEMGMAIVDEAMEQVWEVANAAIAITAHLQRKRLVLNRAIHMKDDDDEPRH